LLIAALGACDQREAAAAGVRAAGDADVSPRWVEIGAKGARYRFEVPAQFSVLSGATGRYHDVVEFGEDTLGGVQMASLAGAQNPNTIVAFTDRENLGFSAAAPISRKLLQAYGEVIKEQFAGAGEPSIVTVGGRQAIKMDLADASAPTQPLHRSRHYLVLDRDATIVVECRWRSGDEASVTAACDEVAATMTTTKWHTAVRRLFWPVAEDC